MFQQCLDSSEVFLPDPPAFHPTFPFPHTDVSQQFGFGSYYHSHEGMDHFAISYSPIYSTTTDDIELSFSDIFLSMVDSVNPQDYDSSFTSSALYSGRSYALPIPSDTFQSSELLYTSWQSSIAGTHGCGFCSPRRALVRSSTLP